MHILKLGSALGLAVVAGVTAQAQWEVATPAPTTADLRGIHYVGNGVAWASGTEGTVLRTVNDGKEWQRCATPPDAAHLDFRGVQAFDASTAIVMSSGKGALSRIYKTTDGCKTWTLLFTNPDAEGFWDAFWLNAPSGEGTLLGDPVGDRFTVFSTNDGGFHWNRDKSGSLKLKGSSLSAFAASNSSIAKADRGQGDTRGPGRDYFPGFITGGKSGAFLYEHWQGRSHTKARFGRALPGWPPSDWNRRNIPLAAGSDSSGGFAVVLRYTGSPCSDCGFGNYWHVVAVGGDYLKPEESSGTAAYSDVDGGWTWQPAQTPPHGYRSAVGYDAETKTWITVGPNGTDISTDDGRNWRALRPNAALHEPADADRHWNALSLPFVVGPHGRIGRLGPNALTSPGTGAKP